MSHFLYRLGSFSYRKKWWILSIWSILLIVLGLLAVKYYEKPASTVSIPGTPSEHALNEVTHTFHQIGTSSSQIVVQASAGKTIDDYTQVITTLSTKAAHVPTITGVVSPFSNPNAISHDRRTAYISLSLSTPSKTPYPTAVRDMNSLIAAARKSGLQVELDGDLISEQPSEILGPSEIEGVILALVVLFMTLGSLIAAGMPIITALIAIGVSMAGLFSLSHLISIDSTTPTLAVMLGLAVGIDYSLFIISRFRSYLLSGYQYKEAAARSIATAGNAVIFAALTVIIALSALTVVRIPFLTTMGLSAAGTVALAALVAISVIPALLGIAGQHVFGRTMRGRIQLAQARGIDQAATHNHTTFWYKWGQGLARYPWAFLLIAVIVAAIIALPATHLTLGLSSDQYAPKQTTQRKAYDMLASAFGPGFSGPLLIVVNHIPEPTAAQRSLITTNLTRAFNQQLANTQAQQTMQYQHQLASATTQAEVQAIEQHIAAAEAAAPAQEQAARQQLQEKMAQYTSLYPLNLISQRLAKLPNVKQALPLLVSSQGTTGLIQVVGTNSPTSSQTTALISYLRDSAHWKQLTATSDGQLGVTGSAAVGIDINNKLSAALPEYLGIVVGLSLILLIVAFRSILIPLKAAAGFLLSVAATFGAIVAVFQWGWFGLTNAPGPIISFLPIITIGVLFGLAMDYEFFIVSSMHEAYETHHNARNAAIEGFGLGSKVVTAAAIIMISVFAGFVKNPDATIQTIGFGLAFGVLIDAFFVRLTIIPALMILLGKAAWWLPKWLNHILPHISLEGDVKQEKSS